MKNFIIAALCATLVGTVSQAVAQDENPEATLEADPALTLTLIPAATTTLDAFKWQNRVIVVFADSALDPSFSEQIELLSARPESLTERAVVVLTDTESDPKGDIRAKLRPHGFALVIIDLDGRVMLRKSAPWDLREITRAIDKTPLRQKEIRDAKAAARSGL